MQPNSPLGVICAYYKDINVPRNLESARRRWQRFPARIEEYVSNSEWYHIDSLSGDTNPSGDATQVRFQVTSKSKDKGAETYSGYYLVKKQGNGEWKIEQQCVPGPC